MKNRLENLKSRLENISSKELIFILLNIVMFFVINSFVNGLMKSINESSRLKAKISFEPKVLFISLITLVFFNLYIKTKKGDKQGRKGEEYGSSKWGDKRDIKPYIDNDKRNNIIFSQTEFLTIKNRMKNPIYERNKNVVVLGGAGSGKTRFFVKPNIMQMHSNYVITDPKGSIIGELGQMLYDNGYKIKVINLIDFSKSMRYNPFKYLKTEKDVLKLVEMLIANTKGEGSKGEDFWVKAERLYLLALISYIHFHGIEEDKNFETLMIMLNYSHTTEQEGTVNAVDMLFGELEKKEKNSFALKQYKKYKLAAGKTAKSILISIAARFAPFDIQEVLDFMSEDEMEFEKFNEEKIAFFVMISDTDTTFNFISSILYSQMINYLTELADNSFRNELQIPLRFIFDEFANTGIIPNFDKVISTIRSRNISASIILQSNSQLTSMYDKKAEIIIDNCDSMLFLGGKGQKTLKEISELLGTETIIVENESKSFGNQKSHSRNTVKVARDLMKVSELSRLSNEKCIYMLRGVNPFLSYKFDITKHERYEDIKDSGENLFDVKKYIEKTRELKYEPLFRRNDKVILINYDDIKKEVEN